MADHLNMQTTSLSEINIEELYKLCPSAFTEVADKDGNLTKKVDFNKLRSLLGDYGTEDAPESYDFTWVGKRAAQREAAAPINKTLRPCPEESVDWDTTQNLYIEGDNLEVLKLLQNSYMGKVKMIYIDPPYNTGNDFVYHDDFAQSADEYDEHNINEEGERFRKNTDSNGRFHSDWCSMMYARLMVARTLLKEDGVIFISIDDNEYKNLSKICDEVFGESNFVADVIWKHTQQSKNDELHFSRQYNYTLCICKNKELLSRFYFERTEEDNRNYSNPDNDPKGLWRSGDVRSPNYRKTLCFNIIAPNGTIIKSPENGWRWSEESIRDKIKSGEIKFKQDYSGIIRKIYLSDQPGRVPENLWEGQKFGTTRQAASVIKDLFEGKQVFDTPKPHELIESMLEIATDKDSIILDFFSGSATTAQAVIHKNSLDEGKRKFILCQINENTPKDSIAEKEGYKTICEIGKERIRRAGKKIKEDSPLTTQNLDTGFRVFKCDSSNMKDVYFSPKDYDQQLMFKLEDNIKEDRSDLDLLFDCMLRWGVELSMPMTTTKVGDCTIHNVNDGDLVACFDGKITEEIIDAIAAMSPLRVVFRDSSFPEASQKMNLFELFKQKCQWTDAEVKNNVKVI